MNILTPDLEFLWPVQTHAGKLQDKQVFHRSRESGAMIGAQTNEEQEPMASFALFGNVQFFPPNMPLCVIFFT